MKDQLIFVVEVFLIAELIILVPTIAIILWIFRKDERKMTEEEVKLFNEDEGADDDA